MQFAVPILHTSAGIKLCRSAYLIYKKKKLQQMFYEILYWGWGLCCTKSCRANFLFFLCADPPTLHRENENKFTKFLEEHYKKISII
jgi:hypothetical protein